MTYKEIEKEFDKEFDFEYDATRTETAKWWLAKINQIIDEMIGEEKDELQLDKEKEHKEKGTMLHGFVSEMKTIQGYNQKVQELKEFKKNFNKI